MIHKSYHWIILSDRTLLPRDFAPKFTIWEFKKTIPETTKINQMTFPTWKYFIWLVYHMGTIIRKLFISSYVLYQKYINATKIRSIHNANVFMFFFENKTNRNMSNASFWKNISQLMVCDVNKQDTTWYDQRSNMKPSRGSSNTNFYDGTSKSPTSMVIDIFFNFFLSMHTTSLVLVYIKNSDEKVLFSQSSSVLTVSDKNSKTLSFRSSHHLDEIQKFFQGCLIGATKKIQSRLFGRSGILLFFTF